MTRLLILPALLLLLVVACTTGPVATDTVTGGAPVTIASPCALDRALNVNTATAVELESLPGIGPALAQRIMAYIAANGPFQTIEELKDVEGIGDEALERLRPCISVTEVVR